MTFPSVSPSNFGAQGVGDRSAEIRRANSRGAKYPKLLCGRSSLYSSFHAAIFALASNKFPNQLAFRHSSRSFPRKLSKHSRVYTSITLSTRNFLPLPPFRKCENHISSCAGFGEQAMGTLLSKQIQ
jgi:hypothetical protein